MIPAELYSIHPLAAAIITTVGMLSVLFVWFCAVQLLANILDNVRVLWWTSLRVRFIVAWWRCRVLNQVVIYSRTAQGKPLI